MQWFFFYKNLPTRPDRAENGVSSPRRYRYRDACQPKIERCGGTRTWREAMSCQKRFGTLADPGDSLAQKIAVFRFAVSAARASAVSRRSVELYSSFSSFVLFARRGGKKKKRKRAVDARNNNNIALVTVAGTGFTGCRRKYENVRGRNENHLVRRPRKHAEEEERSGRPTAFAVRGGEATHDLPGRTRIN